MIKWCHKIAPELSQFLAVSSEISHTLAVKTFKDFYLPAAKKCGNKVRVETHCWHKTFCTNTRFITSPV